MILLLDTSTAICRLTTIDDHDDEQTLEWEAGRAMARGLLAQLRDVLAARQATIHDLSGIGVYRGPGSFTGLRIGLTVANSLADSLSVPIVGETGDDWQQRARQRLDAGDSDRIVLPEYGGEANITRPRK
ncbi:tRNA (adenosine(37)-N6)-threonylcarbamoyltransferase complex dimerization subunit type 1 TsaB [Candidatus Saccharibacteria bacterium]|nr:MAG: tRNA (adenosine(37)-N6)-threonylcarbamoyltransferase complex dimerization subunit type 1 TsaB [Candidatus Saccharibacteria bacterium]